MKPFDLEAAKAGAPVITRDGRPARIICFDREGNYPVVALIKINGNDESIHTYTSDGINHKFHETYSDLLMDTVKKKAWVNIYKTVSGDTIHYTHFEKYLADHGKNGMHEGFGQTFHTQITYEWEE